MKKIMNQNEIEMLEAIKLALSYLNVAKISNTRGAMIKINQAEQVLNKSIGNKPQIHICHICNNPMQFNNVTDTYICLSCNP